MEGREKRKSSRNSNPKWKPPASVARLCGCCLSPRSAAATFAGLAGKCRWSAGGAEARFLADEYRPDVVVLDAELLDESGWLTSAKISTANPGMHIILVADHWTPAMEERARMVGAEQCANRREGAEALAVAILGKPMFCEAV